MSSCSNVQSDKDGRCGHQKALLSGGGEGHLDPEGNEDEDLDFNPFLKETPSSEASSSLSSENEGLGADLVDNVTSHAAPTNANFSAKLTNKAHYFPNRDSENDEEVVMQTRLSPEGSCWEESEAVIQEKLKKRKLTVAFQRETKSVLGKENASSNGTDAVDDAMQELPDPRNPMTSVLDSDEEDAICRRTRARYSLANFTLEELETFLQETDDEADLQHADDEEEYRKFLAAVLQGGDGESQTIEENENVDDEDEENDADFEIEIEEALESELDEGQPGKGQKNKHEGVVRRPETRQNRRQKASVHGKRNLLGLVERPLRPLLPFMPNTQMAPFPALDLPRTTPETGPHFSSSSAQSGLINGFTQNQIGQLYCLIHEHMQLLIQVFSLSVLEPSRQHIASEVQRMISEMVHKRDEVLVWRNVPYPDFCFCPPYIHSSVSDELPQFYHGENTVDSSFASNAQKECPSRNNMMPVSHSNSHSDERIYEHGHGRQVDPLQTAESSLWVPMINDHVLSVLDVAPLRLVGRYMADVSTAVQKYQQRHVEGMCASPYEKEPLFPCPPLPPLADANSEVVRGATPQGLNTSSPGSQQPKKTLAATLVESTKKQSVALVQKDIVKLVQRFFPLFNSALFPHKPPPVAVTNRVLFTDAEDELLALGLMEYNTDWKAIQQRFLPCKSKHQIFVRQKNRCSSKAPENPIKAVRRMKTSPLTAEEKARINEGLRVFKLDWMSIWKFIVPYRDPSLLPRQWRVALGTQKSYKSDAAKKEKRRLYESMRRKSKAAGIAYWQTASEKEDYPVDNADGGNNSGDDIVDDEDEAYVHEAFLADWRPGNSRLISSDLPQSSFSKGNLKSGDLSSQDGASVGDRYGETLSNQGHMHEVLPSSIYSQRLQNVSHFTSVRYNSSNIMASNHLASNLVSKSAKKQVHLRPYRVRRSNALQLVKLAPDLPPVNLPPSVRVISQSAFKSYCSRSSSSAKSHTAATTGGSGRSGHAAGTEDQVSRFNIARSGTNHSVNAGKNKSFPINHNTSNPCSKVSGLPVDQHVAGEKRAELDLQMHPLLFQAPENGSFPYYPLNCGATSGTLSLLPGHQLHANFDLFCKPQPVGQVPSTHGTIEFHPLLQKPNDVSSDSVPALSACHRSVDLESLHGHCAQAQHPESSVLTEPQVRSRLSTSCTIPARPVSPSDKANELDLEIHLSSTSRKDKVIGNRVITENNSNDLQISGADCGTTVGNQRANGPSYQGSSQHYHAVSVASKYTNKVSPLDFCPMVLASSNLSGYAEDITGQQSPQEIVMEQEELSDSDEELGENVEFECEEMADSDGEGSDFEQFVNLQNKEAPSAVVEEDVSNTDHHSAQCKPIICGLQTNACDSKGDTRSCKSGLSNKAGDASSTALLVSLDSRALGPSPFSKPKFRGGGKGDDQVDRSYSQNGFPPRPSRSCKRVTPNSSTQLHHQDMPNQEHVSNAEGTVVFTPGIKTRKRVSRVSTDNTVDRRPDDSCPSVDNDMRISTPLSSNVLHGGNTGAQGLREVQESKPQL